MDLQSFLFGADDRLKKKTTLAPGQEQFFNKLLEMLSGMSGQGGGYGQATNLLQDYLNPQSDVYKNFEAPYMQQFEQQTIPGIAERFAGAGAQGGALSSSGFGQALGAAGSNLQTNLAQMKSQMQRQSIGDILGQFNQMAGLGLGTQPFAYFQQPGSMGLVPTAISSFAQGAGKAAVGGA